MKTRLINTKIWVDSWFAGLSSNSKLFFWYLITNSHMGFSGYAEIPERVILFESGFTKAEFEKCKKELKPKVLFWKDWIYVVNLLKYDPIIGKTNNLWKAYDKEKENIPSKVINAFNKGIPSPPKGFKALRRGNGMVCNGMVNSKGLKKIKQKRKELGL